LSDYPARLAVVKAAWSRVTGG